jgi:hypothetical protein
LRNWYAAQKINCHNRHWIVPKCEQCANLLRGTPSCTQIRNHGSGRIGLSARSSTSFGSCTGRFCRTPLKAAQCDSMVAQNPQDSQIPESGWTQWTLFAFSEGQRPAPPITFACGGPLQVVEEEADHFGRRVRTVCICVRSAGMTSGPGMADTLDEPVLQDRLTVSVSYDGSDIRTAVS